MLAPKYDHDILIKFLMDFNYFQPNSYRIIVGSYIVNICVSVYG